MKPTTKAEDIEPAEYALIHFSSSSKQADNKITETFAKAFAIPQMPTPIKRTLGSSAVTKRTYEMSHSKPNRHIDQGNDIFLIRNGKHAVLIESVQPRSITTTEDWIRVPAMMSSVAINTKNLGIENAKP